MFDSLTDLKCFRSTLSVFADVMPTLLDGGIPITVLLVAIMLGVSMLYGVLMHIVMEPFSWFGSIATLFIMVLA